MKLLGAMIAGGKARRFGSDKAFAVHDGQRLIDIINRSLCEQVHATVICGRMFDGWQSLDDRPAPDLGPLGGLCAALHYASRNGYDAVLSVAVDIIPLPNHLAEWLAAESNTNTRATVAKGQHLLGLWPTTLAEPLDRHLATTADRSLRNWIAASGAFAVSIPVEFANINFPDDLSALGNDV